MNIFGDIFKRNFERAAGKIWSVAGYWALWPEDVEFPTASPLWSQDAIVALPRKYKRLKNLLRKRTRQLIVGEDRRGRKMVLVTLKSVFCPLLDEKYAIIDSHNKEIACVPLSVCQKCPHHIKRDRRYRFPRCELKASKNLAANQILEEAKRSVDEIMGEPK